LPPSIVSTSSGTNGLIQTPDTATIAKPVSITAGNLLVAEVTHDSGPTITLSGSWTFYQSFLSSGSDRLISIYWKVATGSEPSTYVVTPSANATLLLATILNISGANTITPFNGSFKSTQASSSVTAGATSGTPSVPTILNCLPIAVFVIEQLLPSNSGSPTGLTSGWSGVFLNVIEDPSNYNNGANANGYDATFLASGPLTTSTSTAITVSCSWGGAYSAFDGINVLLFVNPIESSYGTLTAYPSSVDLIGSGLSDGMQVSLVETNFTGSFSVTVPTAYQSIVSVCPTQGGTYGTSCSVSGPTNSFWMQGIAPGAFQIDVSGG
jgi:hypothetical protein